jgi:hypothetical protein
MSHNTVITPESDSADQVSILDFDTGNTSSSRGGSTSGGWAVISTASPADFATPSSSIDSSADAAAAAPAAAAVPLHLENLSEAVQSRLAAAAGSTVYSYSPMLPRYSLSGQSCWQQGFRLQALLTLPGQCASVVGREVCPVLRYPQPAHPAAGSSSSSSESAASYFDLVECEPLIEVPINSTYCWITAGRTAAAAAGSSSSNVAAVDSLFEACVVQAGLELCKVAGIDGPWLACPAGTLLS